MPSSKTVNLAESVTFTCTAIGYGITSYMWTIGSGSFPNKVTGMESNTLVIPSVRSSDDNTYSCVASNMAGNGKSTVQLTVTGKTIATYITMIV